MRFEPGEIVLRRHFMHETLSRVWAGRVVADDDRGILLWIAEGSVFRDLVTIDGQTPREVPFPEWLTSDKRLAERLWRGGVLMWHPRDERYSLWLFFGPDRAFRGWYANLEVPVVAWRDAGAAGMDTVDWDLDVWVPPDRSWRWKDEEEFVERLAYGPSYWVDDEAIVRAAGERIVKLVEAGEFPFDGTWCDFAPDPTWTVPTELPPGWDRPRAHREEFV
jgi:hypothetical protein